MRYVIIFVENEHFPSLSELIKFSSGINVLFKNVQIMIKIKKFNFSFKNSTKIMNIKKGEGDD